MALKKTVVILVLFVLTAAFMMELFASEPISFSLYHQVNVDASLEYKFLDDQGAVISSKTLQVGSNEIGGFYASFNTNRQITVGLRWEPLVRVGEETATVDTVYPYVMTITNPSGNALPVYVSEDAGIQAGASEFVVNGEFGSGNAYFINKWLHTSSGGFNTSKICGMTIAIENNDNLPIGTYSGTIYFIASGS